MFSFVLSFPIPNCPGSAKLQLLQDAWTACQGEWKKSELYLKIVERRKTTAHGARVWLTEHQIAAKYGSPDMAREICAAKLADAELKQTHTKPHPDCPTVEAGLLWLGSFTTRMLLLSQISYFPETGFHSDWCFFSCY